jgi:hypothetical protein
MAMGAATILRRSLAITADPLGSTAGRDFASDTDMSMGELIRRLRDEFTAMPGLRLTATQARRLCSVDAATCASALRALVSAGFLRPLEDGAYERSDLVRRQSR